MGEERFGKSTFLPGVKRAGRSVEWPMKAETACVHGAFAMCQALGRGR